MLKKSNLSCFSLSKFFLVFFIGLLLFSCKAPKFIYEHEGLTNLDFTKGKWILNRPMHVNTKNDFYDKSLIKWKEIIRDSLYSLHDVRRNKLISENIAFEPGASALKNIKIGTGCDYLINTKTKVLSDQLSGPTVSYQGSGKTFLSNEANVEVRIYDLNKGKMVAMRKAYGSIKEEISGGGNTDITTALPAEGIIESGIDGIVNYFGEHSNSK